MMNRKSFLIILILVLLGAVAWRYTRPLPALETQPASIEVSVTKATKLPWPIYGQAAVGATDYGLLDSHGKTKPVPMASITKTITALAVLQKEPLLAHQSGPEITITQDDINSYNYYYLRGSSLVKVKKGEKLTEYQALQAMLIPSGNNMADTLARWAFGSIKNFTSYANQMAEAMGLDQTRLADASGLSPKSVTTARDLIRVGQAVMAQSALKEIVKQKAVKIPVAGKVLNTNGLLWTGDAIGIKTGNTDQAGGCFLLAGERKINGKQITLLVSVLGAPNLDTAIRDSKSLLLASDKGFSRVEVAKQGQIVGRYRQSWGGSSQVVASGDLSILAWKGQAVTASVNLEPIHTPALQKTTVGSVTATNGENKVSVPARLQEAISSPSWTWRIFR